jgi:preprotein translocase subunit YajC
MKKATLNTSVLLTLIALPVLASAQSAPTSPEASLFSFWPFVLMLGLMYFLMIRPQQKKQKELRAMMDSLKIDDEVVTIGGIIGRITQINQNYAALDLGNGQSATVQKGAIQLLLPKGTVKDAFVVSK